MKNNYHIARRTSTKLDQLKYKGDCLVAEDSLVNQKVIQRMLNKAGLGAVLVGNGKLAVEEVRKQAFDLIFMDMQMPEMNGYEAAAEIRRLGYKTPIVALTAHAIVGDDKKCYEAGCSDYLTKPIIREKLYHIFEQYLSVSDTQNPDSGASAVTAAELCPINWLDLLERSDNDELFVQEIIDAWLSKNPQTLAMLSEAVKEGNARQIGVLAHTIKGSAATICAEAVARAAYPLEKAGMAGTLDQVQTLFTQLQTEFEKLKTFLSMSDWIDRAKQNT
jgi:CheY-like chemotaxis protein